MRRSGILMLAVAALIAIAALDASGAYAALPEIGRCVKVEGLKEGHKTKYGGKYTDKKCTKTSASSTGKYEWSAGAGTEKTFESPGTLEPVTLKTAAGTAIACKNSKQNGEYTSGTTETDEISLYECVLSTTGETCQSLRPEETPPTPEAGTILSQALEGKLGMIKQSNSKPEIGWEYKAKTGPFLFVFECGGTALPTGLPTAPPAGEVPTVPTPEVPSSPSAPSPSVPTVVTIEGAFISPIDKPVDKMAEEYSLHSVAFKGKNQPEMFEGGATAALTVNILEPKAVKTTTEAIGFNAEAEEQSFSEELEFKAIP